MLLKLKKIFSMLFFKKEVETNPIEIFQKISLNRGLFWDKIEQFGLELLKIEGTFVHHTKKMEEVMPLKHHIKGGLYTRELFMPKGHTVVSFVHKTSHPSFLLKGEVSILLDTGEIKRIKAPMKIMTDIGAQRILYIHEDSTWVCVFRTDAKTVEEAEKDVFTDNYRSLPDYIIENAKIKELIEVV